MRVMELTAGLELLVLASGGGHIWIYSINSVDSE